MASSRKTIVEEVGWRALAAAKEARKQSRAVAASAHADDDQVFIDSISEFNEERTGAEEKGASPNPLKFMGH